MKLNAFYIFIFFLFLSCKKNKFESCTHFEKLIGTWKNIEGDVFSKVTFLSNGKIIEEMGIERTTKRKFLSCSSYIYKGEMIVAFYENKEKFNPTGYYKFNEEFDTMRNYIGSYNIYDTSKINWSNNSIITNYYKLP